MSKVNETKHKQNKYQCNLYNIVFKHPVALIYYLFHTIYFFRLQCNLILVHLLLTTCFGRMRPSSGVYNFAKNVTLSGMSNFSYYV
jgi:hypothetical protein